MVIGEMDAAQVAAFFRGKNILITGATGFLGKVLLEKILRIQPEVTKLFLLVRATDDESARRRVQTEVTGREIFQVLREKHGKGFEDFIEEKVYPLAGDVMYEDFGLDTAKLKEVSKDVDIIVNGAATTNFYERYDVSFDTNVLGAKQICAFANKCTKLKMLLHVSTAYVCGEQEGLILEKPFMMGDTLREGTHLDIESELNLIKHTQMELKANCATDKAQRKTMKELGLKRARRFGWPNTYVFTKAMGEMLLGHLRGDLPVVIIRPSIITSILKEPLPGWMEGVRTIDSVFLGYAKQALKFFLVDPNTIMDVVSLHPHIENIKRDSIYILITHKTQLSLVWTDSGGHGGKHYDGGHASALRGTSTDHLPCDIIHEQPGLLHDSPGVGPPLLRGQPAARGKRRAHPAEQDALL
ncbi:hypothetical protein CFC21_107225 [Triticum aestivum]|uniref:Fatty acyl-CoA reductase n=2 Tax=Triticum aestivum TaxID=4565 RepID=A0A3B6TIY7_WHEAT|nr:hypothetical protein CFC21_107225 [Triticum aestivum]